MVKGLESLRFAGNAYGGWPRRGLVVILVALMVTSLFPPMPVSAAEYSITLRDPDGGEDLVAGSTYRIRWQVTTTGGFISIYLSVNGGDNWEGLDTIANRPSHSFGTYDWPIPPNLNSTTCKVKVVWKDSVTKPWKVFADDASADNFTVAPGVHITFTEMPSQVAYGKYYLTTFDLYDPHSMVDHLRFTWRVNEGSGYGPWEDLPGRFDDYDPSRGWIWWSPAYYESATAQMRVEAVASGSSAVLASDTGDYLTIRCPATFLIQPNGGVTLVAGSTYTIKWATSADPEEVIHSVWLRYWTDEDGIWRTIDYTDNDFEYDWTVPGTVTTSLLVRVVSLYGEWQGYADDTSDGPNTIIASSSVPSVTLTDPNPPVDGGVVMGSGETYPIRWTLTGVGNINSLAVSYSTNNGTSYTPITTLTGTALAGPHVWTVPAVDTYEGRVKLVMTPRTGPARMVVSNNAFYIFDTIEFNRPPVAMAGDDQEGTEGDTIFLDGTGSYDPDGDPLTYTWDQKSPSFLEVTLVDPGSATPSFTVNELHHFPVTFVFELEVSDGNEHTGVLLFNTDRVTVEMDPRPPELTSFTPSVGWAGTQVTLRGNDMIGAMISIGDHDLYRVPETATPGGDHPDVEYTLTIPPDVPVGVHRITLTTLLGESSPPGEIEIFPVPQWQYDNGIGFHNPSRERLNYPWNPFGETGRYRDCFGNQIYLSIWVCIGIPYWTPWDGWECLGYLIEEPFCPDPLAAILYPIAFMNLADNGECFGMSLNALRFYHGDQSVRDFDPGATTPGDLTDPNGAIRRTIDWRHGSQIGAEILNSYLYTLLNGLIPSSEVSGMGPLLTMMKASIDSEEYGIVSTICDEGAHAMVPYDYEEVDPDTLRFYVYDPNREQFSNPETAIAAAQWGGGINDHPPYIEIDMSGVYWEWSFEWVDGTEWSSNVGLGFVPYDVLNGDRTLPTSVEGILHLLMGSASGTVEDGEGGQVGVSEDGDILWGGNEGGIEGAVPLPSFEGKGDLPMNWFLPGGDYTAHITGTEDDGRYNWSLLNNGTSAFSIEEATADNGTRDTVRVEYTDDNPYRGWMTYGTDDPSKEYDARAVNDFGPRTRVYRIIGADLTDDGEHGFGTDEEYNGIVFHNGGTQPTTFTVEFQGNVVSEEVWNGTGPPESPTLPTARREGITVDPGETVTIYPTDWLDLDNALVLMTGEGAPGAPTNLTATEEAGVVTLAWDPPEDDGGFPVLEYNMLKGDSMENLTLLTKVGDTTITDPDVERGKTYHYVVSARNAVGNGPASDGTSVGIPELTAPTQPRQLAATVADYQVTLTWQTPVSDGGSPITGYAILRATDPSNFTQLTTLGVVLEYVDKGVDPGRTYYYQVRALNAVGAGPGTQQAQADIPERPGDGDGDGGIPWWVYLVVALAIVVIIVVVLMTRGGRMGGPEASAPMPPEPEVDAEPPPVMAHEATQEADAMPPVGRVSP